MKQLEVKRKQIEYLSMFFEVVVLWALSRRVGMEGMGFFLIAMLLYVVLWAIVSESISDALGRMIRVRKSKGQYISVQKVKKMAFFWQLGTGTAGAILMALAGSILAEKVLACPYSKLLIWLLAPLVLLRGITAVILGYNQGEGTELPAVVASLLRPNLHFVLGVFLGGLFGGQGEKVSALLKQEHYTAMYTGAGWCLGYTLSEGIILVVTFLAYLGVRRIRKGEETESMRSKDSFSGFLSAFYRNMGSKILVRLLEIFPIVAGMLVYYSGEKENAPAGFGSYFIGYFSICVATYFLMNAVTVPYWGKVAGFLKRDERRMARTCYQGGVHLLFALGLWLCVSISVMAAQVGAMVGFTSPNLVKIVVPGSFWILFMSLAFYFSRMLMRTGKNLIAVGIGFLCDVIFLLIFLILWSNARMGILSLMYAGLISSALYAVLLGVLCTQLLGVRMEWLLVFGIPLLMGAVSGLLEFLLAKLLITYLGNALTVLISGCVGMLIFWCGQLFLRDFRKEELSVMPFGGVLLALGKLMGVY